MNLFFSCRELGMGESLFARLDDAGATFDLNLQYRMNKTIMHLSNELMYSGLLQCGSSEVADTCLVLSEPRVHSRPWLDRVLTSDLQHAAIFLDTNKVKVILQSSVIKLWRIIGYTAFIT